MHALAAAAEPVDAAEALEEWVEACQAFAPLRRPERRAPDVAEEARPDARAREVAALLAKPEPTATERRRAREARSVLRLQRWVRARAARRRLADALGALCQQVPLAKPSPSLLGCGVAGEASDH